MGTVQWYPVKDEVVPSFPVPSFWRRRVEINVRPRNAALRVLVESGIGHRDPLLEVVPAVERVGSIGLLLVKYLSRIIDARTHVVVCTPQMFPGVRLI